MDIRVRKLSVIVIFVLISLFTVSSVLAYMIVSDQGVNHFTVGNNESHIEEKFDSYEMFEKGQEYEKEVSVTNDGTVDCYVRVFAEVENPETAEKIEIN